MILDSFFKKKPAATGKYTEFIKLIDQYLGDVSGKTVLEIGADYNGSLLEALANERNVKEAIGINLNSPDKRLGERVYHFKQDAASTSFEAGEIDVIVSLAVFEHVHDIDAVLNEAFRILHPGGSLFTLFGPIWSSAWGHHLWITIDGKTYNYKNTHLPPFCHLISNESQVLSYLENDLDIPTKHSKKISHYVFNSSEQNRLFFQDYIEAFQRSKLDLSFIMGHGNFPLKTEYRPKNYLELLKQVNKLFPQNFSQFAYNSISAMLTKP